MPMLPGTASVVTCAPTPGCSGSSSTARYRLSAGAASASSSRCPTTSTTAPEPSRRRSPTGSRSTARSPRSRPQHRAAVVLRYHHDYDYATMAGVLDTTPGTVGSLLSRALERMRERLSDPMPSAHRGSRRRTMAGEPLEARARWALETLDPVSVPYPACTYTALERAAVSTVTIAVRSRIAHDAAPRPEVSDVEVGGTPDVTDVAGTVTNVGTEPTDSALVAVFPFDADRLRGVAVTLPGALARLSPARSRAFHAARIPPLARRVVTEWKAFAVAVDLIGGVPAPEASPVPGSPVPARLCPDLSDANVRRVTDPLGFELTRTTCDNSCEFTLRPPSSLGSAPARVTVRRLVATTLDAANARYRTAVASGDPAPARTGTETWSTRCRSSLTARICSPWRRTPSRRDTRRSCRSKTSRWPRSAARTSTRRRSRLPCRRQRGYDPATDWMALFEELGKRSATATVSSCARVAKLLAQALGGGGGPAGRRRPR